MGARLAFVGTDLRALPAEQSPGRVACPHCGCPQALGSPVCTRPLAHDSSDRPVLTLATWTGSFALWLPRPASPHTDGLG